ncbi:RHG27 protein, partial [Calcarius ornatus]|nr:RHG27 protein [Calcarius ornatus]
EAAEPAEEALVLVEYGFEYRAKDGTLVSIKPNERYVLLKRTNPHWWHVRRSGDARPFYIPAQYVKELPPIAAPAPLEPPPSGHTATEAAMLVPQPPPAYEYRFIGAAEPGEPAGGCPVPRRDSVPRKDSVPRRDSVPRKDSVPRRDSVPRKDSMLQKDSAPRRDSPPSLSSFRVLPGLTPRPAEPVRPSHSLDDLARVTFGDPAARAGSGPSMPHPSATWTPRWGYPRNAIPGMPSQLSSDTSMFPQARKESEETPDPIYLNIQELRAEAAASSAPEEPGGSVSDWETHTDTDSGHLFYYNPVTGETTWDCPFGQAADGVSPAASPASSLAHSPELPEWEQHVDQGSGQTFFYNSVTGETSWDPPSAGDTGSPRERLPGGTRYGPMEQRPPTPETDYPDLSPDELECYPEEDYSPVGSYDQGASLCLSPRRPEELGSPPGWYGHGHPEGLVFYPEHFAPDSVRDRDGNRDWDRPGQRALRLAQPRVTSPRQQGGEGEHPGRNTQPALTPAPGRARAKFDTPTFTFQFKSLEKAGVLNRTKTVDRGKRLRKNWSSSWTVLEGGILTFFKDSKHSAASALRHPSTLTTPEHTVKLRGATLTWAGRDKSSKKNVLELRTREGSEFLIQHDSEQIITAWHKAIADSIGRRGSDISGEEEAEIRAEFGSREKLGGGEERRAGERRRPGWARGARRCHPPCGPGVTGTAESDTNRVRNKLRKFLQRRPTMQSLRERGYIKDQVFGCSLLALCERERGTVPRFVLQCIWTVERRGLDIDGLYRVSGNLATIQKLRYKVEHDEQLDLDDGRWEDIHVVTGALKLFLRELPEPLVPFSHFDKFIAAI